MLAFKSGVTKHDVDKHVARLVDYHMCLVEGQIKEDAGGRLQELVSLIPNILNASIDIKYEKYLHLMKHYQKILSNKNVD